MSVVAKALWFIENHFGRSPTLDDVAQAAGTGRFHLSRCFTWATGHSVMAYARGRRLTEALKSLSDGAPSIIEVALEAGYSSHEAFTRAFRDRFGVTPEQARKGIKVERHLLMEPIKMNDRSEISLRKPRIEDRGPFVVAGLGNRFRMDAIQGIPMLWQKLQQYEGTLGAVPGYWYGVCGDWGENGEDFLYIAGVEVPRDSSLLPELQTFTFPARSYLVFRHETHISELQQTMGAIFGRYLPENGYDASTMDAYFELYDRNFDPMTGLGGIELWLPVSKRPESRP